MSATERLKQKRSRNDSGASDRSNTSSASEKKKKTDSSKPKPPKPDISLFMECVEDELSEAQKKMYESKQKSFDKVMKDLEEMAKKGATVKPNSDNSVTFRVTDSSTVGPLVASTTATPATTVTSSTNGGVPTYTCPPGYRLLMDPKTGRIIGSVPVASLGGAAGGAITNTVSSLPKGNAHLLPRQGAPGLQQVQRQVVRGAKTVQIGRGNMRGAANVAGRGAAAARGRGLVSIQARGGARTIARGGSLSVRGGTPPSASPARKSEPQIVDLTDPAVEPVGAPAVKFRKAFPALTVQARSQRPVPGATAKRAELDQKVKGLLVLQAAKFTEWLLQNGLVRTEQYEVVNGEKLKLKLGMYSDGKRFASSGGYVWLHSDRSDVKYTSVLKGSIFEIAPTNALKLIYHWCCQTTITNVIQWVKVDNAFVDKFFYMLRAVASISVQEKIQDMGGAGSNIEIGVISLGTSAAGSKREVRVEVLGVLDRATRKMRIRASDPHSVSSDGQTGSVQKERFRKIFEMLTIWVNKESKIFTDFSVDRDTLTQLGFHNVVQCSLQSSSNNPNTNSQVMDYLKKVVPKMFQNTLSSMNNASLQSFLDELSFRECVGQYPLQSFNVMIEHIEALTKYTANNNEGMEAYLKRVIANPFLDWRLKSGGKPPPVIPRNKSVSPAPSTVPGQKRPANLNPVPPGRAIAPKPDVRRSATPENPDALFDKRMKLAKEFVELESYFYGTLQGEDAILAAEFKADMAFKCLICKKVFMNNIEFMKHLHLHIESERQTAIDFTDLSQCKFCYKDFDNSIKMQEHIDTIHIIKGFQHVCVICNSGFNTEGGLGVHVTKEHVKAEMPYSCQVCGHRTSCHRSIIEHFTEVHDRTDKLQCPLCLKTYSLFNDKGYNSSAAQSYMIHLQKHENLKKKKMSCKKCCLEFVNADVLKYHMEKDHLSYKDYTDIDTSQFVLATSAPLKMPKPEEKYYRLAPKKTGPTKALQAQYAFASVNLEDMAIYDTDKEKCFECKRPMTQAGHYTAYLCCTKCRYSTCCSRAINLHGILFHDKPKPEFNLGKPIILDEEMYCICGFCTKSGNRMAKHLATQGCSTAYGTLESAGEGRKDKDLPPIERITPRPTPAPSPAPSTGSNTSAAPSSGPATPSISTQPKSKTRKVAPAFLKENPYESDPDNPDSDAPPEDIEDGDYNYEPDVAEKYLGSVSRARSEEDVDEPDEPDGKDSDEEMETEQDEDDKESEKVSKHSEDSQGSTASQAAKNDEKDSVKSDDNDEEEKKDDENNQKDEDNDEIDHDDEKDKEDKDEKDDEDEKEDKEEESEKDKEERLAIINEIMNESENMDTD